MRVLVCGSRTFTDRGPVDTFLDGMMADTGGQFPMSVVHGAARGADTLAAEWAARSDVVAYPFPADWDRYGKRAGYVRNQQMLDEMCPDLVVAFVDKPLAESKGTAMMVDIARRSDLPTPVWVVTV